MVLVKNKHTASLGMPGVAVALGGVELQPGDNQVDDKVWAAAKDNDCVKAWLSAGLLVVPSPEPALCVPLRVAPAEEITSVLSCAPMGVFTVSFQVPSTAMRVSFLPSNHP